MDKPDDVKKLLTHKQTVLLLIVSIVSGVGGAFILGHFLELVARSIFGLTDWNIPVLTLWVTLVMGLAVVGTATIVGSLHAYSKPYRWWIFAFALPIPIVIEIVDLAIRMTGVVQEVFLFYGV